MLVLWNTNYHLWGKRAPKHSKCSFGMHYYLHLDCQLALCLTEQSVGALKSHLWNIKPFPESLKKSSANTDWRHTKQLDRHSLLGWQASPFILKSDVVFAHSLVKVTLLQECILHRFPRWQIFDAVHIRVLTPKILLWRVRIASSSPEHAKCLLSCLVGTWASWAFVIQKQQ